MKKFKTSSNIRLPFEPKGEALALKNTIRNGIKSLKKQEYTVLNATLNTMESGFFDVENVLFYNVGSGSFSHLGIDELHFKLSRDSSDKKYEYLYEVESTPKCDFSEKIQIVEFNASLHKITSDLKPAFYWKLIHNSKVSLNSNHSQVNEFGLLIEIELEKKHPNLTSVIKPMIDGIISALHYQDYPSTGSINYLSEKYKLENDLIVEMFKKKPYSILGKRDLISEYRSGVKWNPADEKCIWTVVKQKIADKKNISVKVFEL